MKPATLKSIKSELSLLSQQELIQLLTSVIKYRKENKEFVSYILFDSKDEAGFVMQMKAEMIELMEPVTRYNVVTSLKYIRTILRNVKKIIRFSSNKETEVELLMHFCTILKQKNLPLRRVKGLNKLWERTIQNILKAISTLHEDLRHDYRVELDALTVDVL